MTLAALRDAPVGVFVGIGMYGDRVRDVCPYTGWPAAVSWSTSATARWPSSAIGGLVCR